MYGVIASSMFNSDILEGIGQEPVYHKFGKLNEEDFVKYCLEVGRVSIQTLIIDMDSTENESSIVRGIRQYKMLRPKTRIIVVAVDRKPGNRSLSDLVGLGVHDIIAPSIPDSDEDEDEREYNLIPFVSEQLKMNPTYADVGRWHFMVDEIIEQTVSQQKSKSRVSKQIETRVEERLVIREKVVGTVIIGVAGTGEKTGATHTAIQIANFLNQEGLRTACIEMIAENEGNPAFTYFRTDNRSKLHEAGFSVNSVDYYANEDVSNDNIIDIIKAGYQYIVMDFGNLITNREGNIEPTRFYQEYLRADVQILSTTSSLWNYNDFLKTVETFERWNWKKKLRVAVNLADTVLFNELQAALLPKENQTLGLTYFHMNFQPDPFRVTEDRTEQLSALLEDVIPQTQTNKKSSGKLSFWRKRA